MSKTIKQIADSLGVSKTTVRKYLTPDFRAAYIDSEPGAVITISDAGCALLAETLVQTTANFKPQTANQFSETTANQPQTNGKFSETTANQPQTNDSEVIALLRATVDTLQRQLDVKDQQIAALTTALTAAQALHAGTIQQRISDGSTEPGEPSQPRRWWQFGRK